MQQGIVQCSRVLYNAAGGSTKRGKVDKKKQQSRVTDLLQWQQGNRPKKKLHVNDALRFI
jgi:hypothetical protein